MNLFETFERLSEVSKNLAQKRGEVNQLWERWSDRVFLQMMAEKTSAELLIIQSGDTTHYFAVDMQTQTIRPISQVFVIDGTNNNSAGTDDRHNVSGDNANERVQEDPPSSEEPSPGSQDV